MANSTSEAEAKAQIEQGGGSHPVPEAESWCYTHLPIHKFSHIWEIVNFSLCKEEIGDQIRSHTFSSSLGESDKWCLGVKDWGNRERNRRDYICIYLGLVSSTKHVVRAKFKLSILDEQKKDKMIFLCDHIYEFVPGQDWGTNHLISREHLFNKYAGLVPNNILTIYCEVRVVADPLTLKGSIHDYPPVPECDLTVDFRHLLQSGNLSDITLTTGGKQFKAHKAILTARCPVFSDYFEHSMEGSMRNRIEINDLGHDVLQELLTYIYTDKSPNLPSMAHGLLSAAIKFNIERLKMMCEESLCNNLTVENAADTLILANLHCSQKLKDICIIYINSNATDVVDSVGWSNLVCNHPNLVGNAYMALAQSILSRKRPLLMSNPAD